jgi:nitroimidazol reductase NimA-like FMN-containing flavoprotein (pyridoxamine 5'-phosphate oxidase superfamily)
MNRDAAGLEVLDRTTCLRLLSTTERGRIAINVGALPRILPVHFVVDVERVVVCVGAESAVAKATKDAVVAFEADGCAEDEPDTGFGHEWSVSLIGVARHAMAPEELAYLESLGLRLWNEGSPHRFVTISAEHVAGRRSASLVRTAEEPAR